MHSTQKGGNWYFGMKSHIGVDADSGLVHTVIGDLRTRNVVAVQTARSVEDHRYENDFYRPSYTLK